MTGTCMLQKILHFAVKQEQLSVPTRSRESLYKLGIIYFGVKVQRNLSVAQLGSIEDHFFSAVCAASLQLRDVFYKKIGISS